MPDIRTATITASRYPTNHVRELVLQPDGEALDFAPGQWLSLRLPLGERPPLNRAYSLALPPVPDGSLTLCFDRVEGGLGSSYLWDVPVGASLEFTGPVGNFVLPMDHPGGSLDISLLLVAHYTGIVPFHAILHYLAEQESRCKIGLIYSVPSDTERVYSEALIELSERLPGFDLHLFNASPTTEESERIFRKITEIADPIAPFTAMVCGIREFTLPVRNLLMERYALDRKAVKVENYSGPAR